MPPPPNVICEVEPVPITLLNVTPPVFEEFKVVAVPLTVVALTVRTKDKPSWLLSGDQVSTPVEALMASRRRVPGGFQPARHHISRGQLIGGSSHRRDERRQGRASGGHGGGRRDCDGRLPSYTLPI